MKLPSKFQIGDKVKLALFDGIRKGSVRSVSFHGDGIATYSVITEEGFVYYTVTETQLSKATPEFCGYEISKYRNDMIEFKSVSNAIQIKLYVDIDSINTAYAAMRSANIAEVRFKAFGQSFNITEINELLDLIKTL